MYVTNDRYFVLRHWIFDVILIASDFHLPDDFVHYFDPTAVPGILFQNHGKNVTFCFCANLLN